jgi:hypothetical protein
MTYAHRRWHAWVWLLLGPLIWAGLVAAALLRPAPETEGAGLDPPSGKGPS